MGSWENQGNGLWTLATADYGTWRIRFDSSRLYWFDCGWPVGVPFETLRAAKRYGKKLLEANGG